MTQPRGTRYRLHYVIAIVWLALTVSLAGWWLTLNLELESRLRRMFVWEGTTFIALLIAGGVAIVLAIRREQLRRQALETFFMSFTHDLKTSLTSVQLQAEGLREDWPESSSRDSLDRLLRDIVRLQIQLENSLFVAQPDGRLLRERIDAARAIRRLAEDWPDLTVRVAGAAEVMADARAFDAVIRNLLQNAVIHGDARTVTIDVSRETPGLVRLTVEDDGRGVPAEAFERLGQPFERPSRTSGTGVGLFVCGQLVSRMSGTLRFVKPQGAGHGLRIELALPGAG